MNIADRLMLAGRCFARERVRRRLTNNTDTLSGLQARAWPDRERLGRSWKQERFVVFDTETTGLDPAVDHPVSLGAVSIQSGRIVMGDTFEKMICADKRPSRDSVVVHGINSEKVTGGEDPRAVAGEFLIWAADSVLVAHHAMFDLAMLTRAAGDLLCAPVQNLVLDTVALAGRLEHCDGDGYDLDSLLERYDIPGAGSRHSALGDAILTARLLQKLLKKLEARGVSTLAELACPGMRGHRI